MKKQITWHLEKWPLSRLKPYEKNPRIIDANIIGESISEIGLAQPINVNTDGTILSGHARYKYLLIISAEEVDVYIPSRKLTAKEEQAVIIRMNKSIAGKWDFEVLEEAFETEDLRGWGFSEAELASILDDDSGRGGGGPNLAERFGAPPFSVLDARQGYWKDRKKEWLSLGIKSEEGRPENLLKHNQKLGKGPKYNNYTGGDAFQGSGTSIFDPVLCELSYLWYSKENDSILDPFAGGSVRGVVASRLGRHYQGIDIRKEQVEANIGQRSICRESHQPTWISADSLEIPKLIKKASADMIFSCPPYADLEVYSDAPGDISNMGYPEFLACYEKIIANCYDALKPDRFACFVIGEVRGKDGNFYNFVGDTITAFKKAGFSYYNEAVLITPLGTVMLRASKMFSTGRKLCKTHQNVLVFVKGDWKKAAARLGEVFVPEVGDDAGADLHD